MKAIAKSRIAFLTSRHLPLLVRFRGVSSASSIGRTTLPSKLRLADSRPPVVLL